MMKYANFFILSLLLILGVFFKNQIQLSTNLLSLFASKESVAKLDIANNLGYSKEMLIAVKGFDKSAKKKIRRLTQELQNLKHIKFVQSSIVPSTELQEYYKKYYPLLADFDSILLSKDTVHKRLQTLYDAQFTNVFYTSINKNDPLSLFQLESINSSNITHRGSMITLEKYGYLIRVMTNISPSDMNDAKVFYDEIQTVLKPYHNVVAFAPFFYTVENSAKIKSDVQWIVLLSTIVLLFIYYHLLKNIKLLSQTLIALFSSMLFASLICTTLVDNFNVLSLAFGMSLTAVSIDYLLHYHFHNFYKTTQKIDKNVLYGFLTTITAFGIFSFIPIPLIAQISLFAVLSLSFAYALFTFIFPKLELKKYETVVDNDAKQTKKALSAKFVVLLSLVLFTYSAYNFKLDSNIRNLDYQNLKLRNAEQLFKENSSAKLSPVIVQAKSQEELISRLHQLKIKLPDTISYASFVLDKKSCQKKAKKLENYDFSRLNSLVNSESLKIGFKKDYFSDAYLFAKKLPICNIPDLDMFQSFSLTSFHDNKFYYTMALVSDVKSALQFNFVSDIDVKTMFQKSAKEMYKNLEIFGTIVLLMIFILLYFSVKQKFLYALNFILFPLSFTVAILLSIGSINIMHLFSLIILVAIGIDYGIYMSNSKRPANTMLAIKYSLLSTFAAFGVLVFSSIVALNSIGLVISLGCGAIFILIKVMK